MAACVSDPEVHGIAGWSTTKSMALAASATTRSAARGFRSGSSEGESSDGRTRSRRTTYRNPAEANGVICREGQEALPRSAPSSLQAITLIPFQLKDAMEFGESVKVLELTSMLAQAAAHMMELTGAAPAQIAQDGVCRQPGRCDHAFGQSFQPSELMWRLERGARFWPLGFSNW